MANTKKTSTTKKRGTASGSRSGARTKQPPKRPIRREVGGGICLVVALIVVASYFGVKAIALDWSASLFRGLFGYGYYACAPVLAVISGILLLHKGRPVRLRVSCAATLPLWVGALLHMGLSKAELVSSLAILPKLWSTGNALESGGVLGGALAIGMVAVLSKVVSMVLVTLLLLVAALIGLRISPAELWEKQRNRQRLEYEPYAEPEPPQQTAMPLSRGESRSVKPVAIDIPLDGEKIGEKKPTLLGGFFSHKSEAVKTPDQLLSGESPAPAPIPTPPPEQEAAMMPPPVTAPLAPPAPPAPVPETIAAALLIPDPPAETAAAPIVVEKRPKAMKTSEELVAAAQAVTREIEDSQAGAPDNPYQYPPISLLEENRSENFTEVGAELRNNSRRLGDTLRSFGVEATPGEVVHGPSVTRYEFILDQGVKLSKITNLADDIALALGASGVRIAAVPDKISVVGIEVPNKQVTQVCMRDVIESREFAEHKSNVAFSVGRDIGGNNIIGDISRLPHVLIAGTTGSGKSVCTNSLIISMLYKSTPDQARFIMVDPKMVELAPYNGIPHLLIPVVTDPKKAAGALQWAVFEMMKRYKMFSENNVKDLAGFNTLAGRDETLSKLPTVVVVIDELADLMLVAAKEVEESICRVAQMGRAAGMHLVIATQRPSADVITGLMKANIPSRIAFAVASSLESRIILDTQGAEKLVGKGDMLYAPLGAGKPKRVQGCFIGPEEIERVVSFVKQSGEADYSEEVMQKIEESIQEKDKGKGGNSASLDSGNEDGDELLPAAVDVVIETGQASVSMLQRRLKLGYSRAARLVDQMEDRGIVGPFEGSKPRQLLITRAKWQELQMGGSAVVTESPQDEYVPDLEEAEEESPF